MEDILNNMYSNPENNVENTKTADEVWKEIVGGQQRETMTLEEFLSKAVGTSIVENNEIVGNEVANENNSTRGGNVGYVGNEIVMVANENNGGGNSGVAYGGGVVVANENNINGGGVMVGYGGAMVLHGGTMVVGERERGRGKRRAVVVEEPVLDKATQQKQRRMIKNRESAARSRERKQAYTVELEALVTQLEEENARLLAEEAEECKKRAKKLKEHLIPVEDKLKHEKPPKVQALRRTNSMRW